MSDHPVDLVHQTKAVKVECAGWAKQQDVARSRFIVSERQYQDSRKIKERGLYAEDIGRSLEPAFDAMGRSAKPAIRERFSFVRYSYTPLLPSYSRDQSLGQADYKVLPLHQFGWMSGYPDLLLMTSTPHRFISTFLVRILDGLFRKPTSQLLGELLTILLSLLDELPVDLLDRIGELFSWIAVFRKLSLSFVRLGLLPRSRGNSC